MNRAQDRRTRAQDPRTNIEPVTRFRRAARGTVPALLAIMKFHQLVALPTIALFVGCGDPDEGSAWIAESNNSLISFTGTSLTSTFNALSSLYRVAVWNGREAKGESFERSGADGRGYRVDAADGRVKRNASMILRDSTIRFEGLSIAELGGSVILSSGAQRLRITDGGGVYFSDGVTPMGVSTYYVELDDNGVWVPLYRNAQGAAIPTVALRGWWNTSPAAVGTAAGGEWRDDQRITFAARGYALSKCVELGYDHQFESYHHACVRLLRADYCGDGNSWTLDGTRLSITDRKGVQGRVSDAPIPGDPSSVWKLEAYWNEQGATCTNGQRIANLSPTCGGAPLASAKPACSSDAVLEDSATTRTDRPLMLSEIVGVTAAQ